MLNPGKTLVMAVSLTLLLPLWSGCEKGEFADNSVNIFTIEDDKALGMQFDQEISSDTSKYKILSETAYPEAYNYLRGLRNTILNSGTVKYKDEFAWSVKIIQDDSTLNAFCTPGGYIYVYSGLIKFLDREDELTGVLGHEMAHADRRHSTDQLTKQYGLATLLDVALGQDRGQLSQILEGLIALKFSRTDETEADKFSVNYLYPTRIDARGAAGFFEKITAAGGINPPEFLSTHPNPDNRVANINAEWQRLGGKEGEKLVTEYTAFKAMLP